MKTATTNTFNIQLTAATHQWQLISEALTIARLAATAPRTVSEYSGILGKIEEQIQGANCHKVLNLEEVKSVRRALKQLCNATSDAEQATEAMELVEVLNTSIPLADASRKEGEATGEGTHIWFAEVE